MVGYLHTVNIPWEKMAGYQLESTTNHDFDITHKMGGHHHFCACLEKHGPLEGTSSVLKISSFPSIQKWKALGYQIDQIGIFVDIL